jgi:hypothetical protein
MSLTFNNNNITLAKSALKLGISKIALDDGSEDAKFSTKVSGLSGKVHKLIVCGSWRSYGPYKIILSPIREHDLPTNMDLTLEGYRKLP